MEVFEYPSSIEVRWSNFLEALDNDTPWVHCDGKSSVFPVTWSSGHFGFEMEKTMDEFDKSITYDPEIISWWAEYLRRPVEEIANVKFAMGFVTGQYQNDTECVKDTIFLTNPGRSLGWRKLFFYLFFILKNSE